MLTCGVADLSFPRVAAARGGFFCRPERSEGTRPRRDPSLRSGRPKAAVPASGGLIRPVKSRHSRLVDSINAIFRSARHLLDLALAANSLVDIIEFFEVDEPVDVI